MKTLLALLITVVLATTAHAAQYPEISIGEVKAAIAEGKVVLEADEENPGYYSAKFFLKPHYQLEGLTASLRLVSRMPK